MSNPDGKTGVNLHLDAGKVCPSRSYSLKGGGSTDFAVRDPACAGPGDLAGSAISRKRLAILHLAGVAGPLCGGAVGLASQTSFIVDGTYSDFAHVFMHELGHNLGLTHGPADGPNRLTVMAGPVYKGAGFSPVVDFQRFEIGALDESSLSEAAGLDAGVNEAELASAVDVFAATAAEWPLLDYSCGGQLGKKPPAPGAGGDNVVRD